MKSDISKTIYLVFVINFVVTSIIYMMFTRKLPIPKVQHLLIFVAFLVSPVFLVVKGVESTIYISDLLSPIVFLCAAKVIGKYPGNNRIYLFLFLSYLILLPVFDTMINFIIYGISSLQFDSRNFMSLIVWLYRNFIYLSVFTLASSKIITIEEFVIRLKCILLYSFGMVAIGLCKYVGILDTSVYEIIEAATSVNFGYYTSKTTLGWGFLGMFRGSVGQICSNLFCICIVFIIEKRGFWRWFSVILSCINIILVVCSFSRAGLVGIAVSFFMILFMMGIRGVRLIFPATIFIMIILPLYQINIIENRINSIETYPFSKKSTRIDAWSRSYDYLKDNVPIIFFGNGPNNREGVFKAIGAYGAHNEFIDTIFRTGIIGLLILFMLNYFLLKNMIIKRYKAKLLNERAWLSVIPALLISNIIISLSQDHFYRDNSGYSVGILTYYIYGLGIAVQSNNYFFQRTNDSLESHVKLLT